MDLQSFLVYLCSSGGNIAAASFLLEQLDFYQAQLPRAKKLIFAGVALVLALAGYVVLTYVPKEVLDAMAPFFGILYATVSSVFLGEVFHQKTK